MTKQKTALEGRSGDGGAPDKPRKGKQRRTAGQLEEVRRRGEYIAGIVGAVIAISSIKWEVSSQTVRGLRYIVTLGSQGLICQCSANAGGKKICKHAFSIHKFLERAWWKRPRRRMRIRRQGPRCRHRSCRSYETVRNGRRRCKRKGPVQRHLCKSCGRTFSGIDGFVGRHFEATIIIKALSMTAARMSPGEVRVQFKLDGITIHQDTIARWSGHYSGIICRYSAALRVDAGHQWHVDEMFFRVRGATRYLFAVMDGASRFILSYEVSPLKHGADPSGLFARAAGRSLRLPRVLVSDGLHEFRAAARKVFYRAAGPRFVHIREIHIQNMFNQNNVYERLNGEFKDRLRCTRGLKSENSPVIHMLIIYHNFFRKHSSLEDGMTPAEAVGIEIVPVPHSELAPECDRWITLIQNAALGAAA